MDWTPLSLNTLVPQIPQIVNNNFTAFKLYMDLFYDEGLDILVKPLNTTGRVKGATGEFVNVVVDNLTEKISGQIVMKIILLQITIIM